MNKIEKKRKERKERGRRITILCKMGKESRKKLIFF